MHWVWFMRAAAPALTPHSINKLLGKRPWEAAAAI